MEATYEAIRDYIVSKIVASWPSVGKVYADREEEECIVYDEVQLPGDHYDFALVKLVSCEATDGGTMTADEYMLTWQIGGKFWTGTNTTDAARARIARVSALRSQLLSSNNPGDACYMPHVTSMSVSDDDDPLGDSYVASLTFTCLVEIDR